MILELLLSFEYLSALRNEALEFILTLNSEIMLMDFLWSHERTISNLTSLYQSLYAAFVPKVGTSQLFNKWFEGQTFC